MAGDWGESGEGVNDALTRAIIDAIIKVHKVLGPGFGEAIYRRALVVELKKQNISVATEVDHSKADYRRVVSPPSPIIPPIS